MTGDDPDIGSTPIPADQRRFTLAARERQRLHARMEARFIQGLLFYADRIWVEPEANVAAAHHAFAGAVHEHAGDRRAEVLVWDDPKWAAWRTGLEQAGFRVARRKAYVDRSLEADLPPDPPGLELRTLADVAEADFLSRMTAATVGDPFEDRKEGTDPAEEWKALIAYAGERFDPSRWFLVDDAEGPVGVVLPQATSDENGTLFYVAVLPERRGEGLGTRLHAKGLHLLAGQGVTNYFGSTDLRNEAMSRVFERNGCQVTATQLYYERPPG